MQTPSSLWKLSPFLVCCLGIGETAFSAQTPPMVSVGAGSQSCGEWLTTQEKATKTNINNTVKENMILSWVQGYVVGSAMSITLAISGNKSLDLAANQARNGTVSGWAFDPPDSEATKHWITKHCRENPLERITDASMDLVAELVSTK